MTSSVWLHPSCGVFLDVEQHHADFSFQILVNGGYMKCIEALSPCFSFIFKKDKSIKILKILNCNFHNGEFLRMLSNYDIFLEVLTFYQIS